MTWADFPDFLVEIPDYSDGLLGSLPWTLPNRCAHHRQSCKEVQRTVAFER